ncbi:MAG: hypothetical protein EBR02_01860 [Alphaproteobacteria bacterium]|nr:hypothetical protein [Alphaproteobacteria bacterium]
MKLHRIIFIGLAAWAGMMAYRAQLLVSPLLPKDMGGVYDANSRHRSYIPNRNEDGGYVYSDKSIGGIGQIGNAAGVGSSGLNVGGIFGGNESTYANTLRPAQDENITFSLLRSAAEGDEKKLRNMIDEHVLLNARDVQKRTALMYAAWNGKDEACKLLLESGANIKLQDKNSFSAFDYAASRGHVETVKRLLLWTKTPDNKNYVEYATLMNAAYNGDVRILPSGRTIASINRISLEDQSPLMVAAGNGSVALIAEMVERGANINLQNHEKQTPLHWAVWNRQMASIRWLIAHGADRKLADKNGNTAIMLAQEKNDAAIIALLQ